MCDIHHEGFGEDLDFDHCLSVLSVLLVLGELYVCIIFLSEENVDMECTLSELHDCSIVLNIRNIYSYTNLITVFLYDLTRVIQKIPLDHGFHVREWGITLRFRVY